MTKGIIGKKLGMTQIFNEQGQVVPVTVIQAGPCPVVQVKTRDADGYDAVQLAFDAVSDRKLSRPELGHLKRFGVGLRMSMRRLCVRTSKCSRESLSLNGLRITQYTFFSVGRGTGPVIVAPLR